MIIKIEVDEHIEEDEIQIKCREYSEDILRVQSLLSEFVSKPMKMTFYKDNQEFFLPLKDILFFQTDQQLVTAHTVSEVYHVKYRLYELEDILPSAFVRVSKSTIVNSHKIYSILKSITSASKVEFQHTHKKIYVSRNYYQQLKDKLQEKRY